MSKYGSSWTTKNFEYITDNSFYLLVKEVSQRFEGKLHIYSTDVKKTDPVLTPEVEGFVETFSISKWIETAPDSGIYTATFVHGLNTDVIETAPDSGIYTATFVHGLNTEILHFILIQTAHIYYVQILKQQHN